MNFEIQRKIQFTDGFHSPPWIVVEKDSESNSLMGKTVLVLGGGISGKSAFQLAQKKGAQPVLADRQRPADWIPEEFFSESDIPGPEMQPALIIKSPGISPQHPLLNWAREKHIRVISEIEFARRFFRGKIVGITGTDGKSTTTVLTNHLIRSEFPTSIAGGNIGLPFSDFCCENIPICVLELSSYQLEDSTSPLDLDISVFLNLAEDHLERHGSMDNYYKAKMKIASLQNPGHVFVVSQALKDKFFPDWKSRCKVITFGIKMGDTSVIPESNQIRTEHNIYDTNDFPIPGQHNLLNLAAAITAAENLGIPTHKIQEAIRTFRPLPHRFQTLGIKNGIQFINDSKSTNIHSLLAGISGRKDLNATCMILGGRPKKEDIGPLLKKFEEGIGFVYLIGEAGSLWSEFLRPILGDKLEIRNGLEDAMKDFWDRVQNFPKRFDSLIFSPGCPSFDQYKNFEERGEHFIRLYEELP